MKGAIISPNFICLFVFPFHPALPWYLMPTVLLRRKKSPRRAQICRWGCTRARQVGLLPHAARLKRWAADSVVYIESAGAAEGLRPLEIGAREALAESASARGSGRAIELVGGKLAQLGCKTGAPLHLAPSALLRRSSPSSPGRPLEPAALAIRNARARIRCCSAYSRRFQRAQNRLISSCVVCRVVGEGFLKKGGDGDARACRGTLRPARVQLLP
jgi:hypothetical protein